MAFLVPEGKEASHSPSEMETTEAKASASLVTLLRRLPRGGPRANARDPRHHLISRSQPRLIGRTGGPSEHPSPNRRSPRATRWAALGSRSHGRGPFKPPCA